APPPGGSAAAQPPESQPELGWRGSAAGRAGAAVRVRTPGPEPGAPAPAGRRPRRWWQPGFGDGGSSAAPPTAWVVGCDDEGKPGAGQTTEPLANPANSGGHADIGQGQGDPGGRSENHRQIGRAHV